MMSLYIWAQMNSKGFSGAIQSNTGYKAMADDRTRPVERLPARDREDSNERVVGQKGEAKGKRVLIG